MPKCDRAPLGVAGGERKRLPNFLITFEELRAHLRNNGLHEEHAWDETADAIVWFDRKDKPAASPLGLHLLLGAHFPEMLANQVQRAEGRVRIVQAVCRKRT